MVERIAKVDRERLQAARTLLTYILAGEVSAPEVVPTVLIFIDKVLGDDR